MTEHLGDNLRARRRALGLSQDALAARAHVTRSSIAQWETGRAVPPPARLQRVADACEITPEHLLGPPIETPPPKGWRINTPLKAGDAAR